MHAVKRILAALLCACLCLSVLTPAANAAGATYTQIGDVRFYGGRYLNAIDLSALVRESDTLYTDDLYLCRIYDDPQTAIETWNYDRIANFRFSNERIGVAVLADYPGASATVDPGDYILFAPQGNLFDDVPYYAFSAKEYYHNTPSGAYGLRLNTVGLPEFSDFAVIKAEGETVYTMRMTLEPSLVAFYDAVNPDALIEIECKYGYETDDTFCTVRARPAAFDAGSGELTIELLGEDGSAGAHMHNFRVNDEDYGYVFRFTFFAGLFTCGSAKSAFSSVQIAGSTIEGMPERIFSRSALAGKRYERLHGMLYSEKRVKRTFAVVSLILCTWPVFLRLLRAGIDSVRAYNGNALDGGFAALRQILRGYLK